ncbi:MAG TPA: four helix bundle protein [Candidatus Angelobacter sp.]|nr:four helix bundle protein [Candidatus Angelobacter sp.]
MESGRARLSSYKDLVVWQKSVELVTEIYAATAKFPREESFGLTSQLRRCAVSVPSNIAEGQGRATKGEFIQFLGHARGSLFELETQVHIAGNLSSDCLGRFGTQIEEVARILNGLLTSLGVASRKPSTIH